MEAGTSRAAATTTLEVEHSVTRDREDTTVHTTMREAEGTTTHAAAAGVSTTAPLVTRAPAEATTTTAVCGGRRRLTAAVTIATKRTVTTAEATVHGVPVVPKGESEQEAMVTTGEPGTLLLLMTTATQ